MVVTRREFLVASAAVPALLRQAASARQPQGRREPLKLGDDRDGFLYVPPGYSADKPAAPLLIMLHGAGNTALSVQYALPLADDLGILVLAPDSRDERTWDGVLRNWGPDVEFLTAAMEQTLARYRVDRARIGVGGFSDGASYALSFGISFGDQFSSVIAMSPGVMQPMAARGKPRIFISHGTADPIMPIDATSRRFVPKLKSLGYDVTYREYEGRHSPSPPVVREAFEWFLH